MKLVKIETVYGMTCRVERLDPKPIESLVLIKHDSYHLYESSILPFSHPILLSSVWGGGGGGGEKPLLGFIFF
jgi:hypothetical protein